MLDILRSLRSFIDVFSKMEFMGIHIDWFFHLVGLAIVVIIASRYFKPRRTYQIAGAVIIAKEVFDVFAKSRLEYIRPPGVDILFDVTAGILGIFLGTWIARRFMGERNEK